MPPVVLITGAAGGLGKALTEKLTSDHWHVVAGYHRTPLCGISENVTQLKMDVTDREAVADIVEQVTQSHGRIDVLINNAGVTRDHLNLQTTEKDWDHVHDVNLRGSFLCSQSVLPIMVRQGSGHILNISSYSGRSGAVGQSAYSAAKAGLIGFTMAIAQEYGSKNIRANVILPGVLKTGMTKDLSESQFSNFRKQNVLGRLSDLREVASVVAFLCGTQNISGQVFQLDSRIVSWA